MIRLRSACRGENTCLVESNSASKTMGTRGCVCTAGIASHRQLSRGVSPGSTGHSRSTLSSTSEHLEYEPHARRPPNVHKPKWKPAGRLDNCPFRRKRRRRSRCAAAERKRTTLPTRIARPCQEARARASGHRHPRASDHSHLRVQRLVLLTRGYRRKGALLLWRAIQTCRHSGRNLSEDVSTKSVAPRKKKCRVSCPTRAPSTTRMRRKGQRDEDVSATPEAQGEFLPTLSTLPDHTFCERTVTRHVLTRTRAAHSDAQCLARALEVVHAWVQSVRGIYVNERLRGERVRCVLRTRVCLPCVCS